jgi:4-hydroxybutyrate CoA-transferase
VAINSALEVDLLGQAAADAIGPRQFSGVGGQVDFVRGASLAPGGRSIIALPSTAKGDAVSRIAASLQPGTAVTTSRNDVDYVVTEYGVAALRGKSVRERMRALVDVAHPKFRGELDSHRAALYG